MIRGIMLQRQLYGETLYAQGAPEGVSALEGANTAVARNHKAGALQGAAQRLPLAEGRRLASPC